MPTPLRAHARGAHAAAVAVLFTALAGARPSAANERGVPPVLPPPPAPQPSPPAPAQPQPPRSTAGRARVMAAPAPADANADKPSTEQAPPDTRVFVAPMLGFASDNLNFGVGVRGGKTFENRLYVGGSFVYHFGQSQTATSAAGGVTATATASSSAFYIGPEAGYDFQVGPVLIRPYLGLGLAALSISASGGGTTVGNTDTRLVFWPGGLVQYAVPDSAFFVGGDLRVVTIPGGPSVGLFAFGGMRFGT